MDMRVTDKTKTRYRCHYLLCRPVYWVIDFRYKGSEETCVHTGTLIHYRLSYTFLYYMC